MGEICMGLFMLAAAFWLEGRHVIRGVPRRAGVVYTVLLGLSALLCILPTTGLAGVIAAGASKYFRGVFFS